MKNIAPDIFKQRLLIEGYSTIEVTREVVIDYLPEVAKHLDFQTCGAPTIFSSASGKKNLISWKGLRKLLPGPEAHSFRFRVGGKKALVSRSGC